MMGGNIDFSVVVPVYCEAKSLVELTDSIAEVFAGMGSADNFEILFVDDGSTDDSRDILRELVEERPYVRSIFFRRNQGKSMALMASFFHACGDIVITMDGDLQDDPKDIPVLLAKINEGYDIVSGYRQRRSDGFIRATGSKLFNYVVNRVSGLDLHDFNCGFKMFRANALKYLMVFGQFHRLIPLLGHHQGFKVSEVPVRNNTRKYGCSRYPAIRINGFFDLLSILFTAAYQFSPLYFFGRISLFIVVPSIIIALYLTGTHVLYLMGLYPVPLYSRPLFIVSLFGIMSGVYIFLTGFLADLFLHHHIGRNLREIVDGMIEEKNCDQ